MYIPSHFAQHDLATLHAAIEHYSFATLVSTAAGELTASHLPQPWRLDEPKEFVDSMLRQIVAFRIPITRLEGKWKLNQNRPAEQREKVVNALLSRPDENSREIAELMGQCQGE